MGRHLVRAAALVVAIVVAACGHQATPEAPTPIPAAATLAPAVRAYLDTIVGNMQVGSINRLTINWTDFRAKVFAEAGNAQSISETYSAIRVAIQMLGDGHSSYRSATGTVIFVAVRNCSAPIAATPVLPITIGYVKVGAFSGTAAEATAFANGIQRAIASADRDDLIGWIVDLRNNGGGNMWPMVAGLGPVLGDGPAGYFIDPTSAVSLWEFRDGASWLSGQVAQRVDAPYTLRRQRPRVAVLTNNGVASSGEATAISFRQRPDTRSFGTPTCGLSTSNRTIALSDGATLTLTTAVMADRAMNRYGDQVPPDELVTDPEQAVARAVEWLQTGR